MRVSDEDLEKVDEMWADEQWPWIEKIIADLRDLRAVAREAVDGWDGINAAGADPEDWMRLRKAIDKLREAVKP